MPLPIATVFADRPDPRRETANKVHRLVDILVIATGAVLGGAETWDAIAADGPSQETFFRRFLTRENGTPSRDTFERVFAKLDPVALSQAFGRWMAAACDGTGLIPIAIDGTSARSARRATAATGCLHRVRAWATECRLTLGQVSVPDGSNEIATIPELLRTLDLGGAMVTIDAAGCPVENARLIRPQRGHDLLAVKDHQPTRHAAIAAAFDRACEAAFVGVRYRCHESSDDAHGRHEERYVTVLPDPTGLPAGWVRAAAVVRVVRERTVDGRTTMTTHHDLSSYRGAAGQMARWARGHWGIENGPHWFLDVVFGEDDCRVRAGHAGANLAMIRKVAVALLRRAPGKGSTVTKRLKAGWDDEFLLRVLQGIDADVVR